MRVLFVDDEPNVLDSIRRQLRKSCEILTATSGAEALALLKDTGPVALVISDMRMPGMSGAELLASKKNLPSFKGLSKFPEVRRDIAIVLDEDVSGARVLETARQAAGELLVNLKLFDVYRGQGIDTAKKSMALGVVLQHRERTLTDEEVNATMDRMVAALADQCGAALRY